MHADGTCAVCGNPRDYCTCDWRGPYPQVDGGRVQKSPPKRHVRVFRVRPDRWSYVITGSEPGLPFQAFTRSWRTAVRRGLAWHKVMEMRVPEPLGW